MPDTKGTVRRGYNLISRLYRDDLGRGPDAKDMTRWLSWLEGRIGGRGRVLELGCGMGVPAVRRLSRKFDYLGIDISDVQVQRARSLVPGVRFRRADMARLRFGPSAFDAVVSFYAIIHLPLGEQRPLLKRVFKWLRPGGVFAAILGHGRWTGRERDWHGAEMFFSHQDHRTYRAWLEGMGFEVERRNLVREGRGGHHLFLCRKPVGAPAPVRSPARPGTSKPRPGGNPSKGRT
jgi:SAM-dependent methyltransferase